MTDFSFFLRSSAAGHRPTRYTPPAWKPIPKVVLSLWLSSHCPLFVKGHFSLYPPD